MKKNIRFTTMISVVILTIFISSNITYFLTLRHFNNYLADFSAKSKAYSKFDQIYRYVSEVFVGEYDAQDAMDSAMEGYIEGLGDKWSHYLTQKQYSAILDSFNNSFTGIGVSVQYSPDDKALIISQVYDGSPAQKAGLDIGDAIVAADGLKVGDVGYYNAVSLIRGESGTETTVTVVKKNTDTEKDYTLKRSAVKIRAVSSKTLEDEIGYIKIDNFDANVSKNFLQQLDELLNSGIKGIIFDVRNNGGGSDTVLLPMLDRLLPSGVIFSMKDKKGNVEEYVSDETELDIPIVILVNENSYSAAEFFAAALQELNKAVIVGEHTSGKGFAQSTIPLDDGSALYLSTRAYYTPNGNSLAGVGVAPDFEVSLQDGSASDEQLDAALQILKSEIDKYYN